MGENGLVDVIIAADVVYTNSSPPLLLGCFRRLLKSGGHAIVVGPGYRKGHELLVEAMEEDGTVIKHQDLRIWETGATRADTTTKLLIYERRKYSEK